MIYGSEFFGWSIAGWSLNQQILFTLALADFRYNQIEKTPTRRGKLFLTDPKLIVLQLSSEQFVEVKEMRIESTVDSCKISVKLLNGEAIEAVGRSVSVAFE